MSFFKRLFSKNKGEVKEETLAQGAKNFIEGKSNVLTSADVNPEGAAKYSNYERAMALKKDGKLQEAAALLEISCTPPSIYKGHYRELFNIWRQLNRDSLKKGDYQIVIDRVTKMIRYDDEMIEEMLRHWSIQQRRKLAKDYFDKDRNLKISDAKALLKAAKAIGDIDNEKKAETLVALFTSQGPSVNAPKKPLKKQCDEIGIPLVELNIPKGEKPALSVYEHYTKQGYVGAHCKGGAILTVIKALTIDVLEKYNQIGREDAISRFLEAQFELLRNPTEDMRKRVKPKQVQEEIFEAIQSIEKPSFLRNFEEIISDSFVRDTYPGLTLSFASAFIDAVTRNEIENITKKIFSSPYTYRAGWPDLTLVKGEKVKFVEVKTTSKLISSQLRTISDMRQLIQAEFIVVRLK